MVLVLIHLSLLSLFFFHESLAVFHVVVILNPIVKRRFKQFLQVKLVLVIITNVFLLSTSLEMRNQIVELLVFWVLFERGDRDAV